MSGWRSWYRYALLSFGVLFMAEGVDYDVWWQSALLFLVGCFLLSRFERNVA